MWSEFVLEKFNELSGMSWPAFLQPYVDSFVNWVNEFFAYWDLEYLEFLLWLFLPIFVAFVLPIFLLFFIYGCVIFLHIYGLRHRIREAYASSYWDGARTSIASFWDAVGYLWHGYDVNGLENIPDTGPGLVVAYHGTLPLDLYYLVAKCILYKKRTIHCVADKFVFQIPGWGKMCKVFCMTPGTVEDCIDNLNKGNLLIIAPGGVREALFSNSGNYQIIWGKRLGFAKVIIGAKTPVIPMFTENCRDAFRTPRWGRRLFRGLYEYSRLPICPIYGGLPVKMITHLGEPMYFDESSLSPEQIKCLIKKEIACLIREHQVLPGSIIKGILQRIRPKKNKTRTIVKLNNHENCLIQHTSETENSNKKFGRRYGTKNMENFNSNLIDESSSKTLPSEAIHILEKKNEIGDLINCVKIVNDNTEKKSKKNSTD